MIPKWIFIEGRDSKVIRIATNPIPKNKTKVRYWGV